MSHDHPMTVDAMLKQDFWEALYQRDEHRIWSGNVNVNLRTEVEGLKPGHALDLGSGEGGDAIWLAKQGWTVDGVDISTTALARAAEAGAEAGVTVNWLHRNILEWRPEAQYDLVSAQYMHLPPELFGDFFARIAAAVRPGGTLLVVGHHPDDLHANVGRTGAPDRFVLAEQLAAGLDPAAWEVVVARAFDREARDLDGQPVNVRDTVLRAVRRA